MRLYYVGSCSGSPDSIVNATGPTGDGNYEGDKRTFVCSGNFMWTDRIAMPKFSTCLADGKWSIIQAGCSGFHIDCDFLLFNSNTDGNGKSYISKMTGIW